MASPEGGKASGNIYSAPGSTEGSGAYLKCLCTKHRVWETEDELEALVGTHSHNTIGISETWGMSSTIGVLGWRATDCPGGIGRAGEVEVLHYM